MKTETRICDTCGKDISDTNEKHTHTKLGKNFCNYECMEDFYGGNKEIPDDEEFLCVG